MAVCDAHVFPGFLPPVLKQLFFPKPPTTFLTCFCRDERRKYAGRKVRPRRGSNSQPPGHESNTLTTEPPGRGPILSERASFFHLKLYNIVGKREKIPAASTIFIFTMFSKFNPLFHRYSFQRINNRKLLKTLWEKEKLLVRSNFSFSLNAFYSIR